MPLWTKEHARLIGRIIFADLLELPLEKYKRFIEKVEASLFDKPKTTVTAGSEIASPVIARLAKPAEAISVRRLSRGLKSTVIATKQSPNVVARIARSGKDFSIRYTHEGFNRVYQFDNKILSTFLHKLRRISSRNELTHKILNGIIEHQKRYLKTGSPIDLVPFSQVELVDWINGKVPRDEGRRTRDERRKTKSSIVHHPSSIVCNTWVSRLVSKLSVITPPGEEKALKTFFQTQKDINKRLIKQLLDKESEDLQSGKLKRPYTDNELKGLLETLLRERRATSHERRATSRHSVCHCRKDMGIPPAGKRLSGYKYPPLSANFSLAYPMTMESVIKNAPEASGVYELSIKNCIRTTSHERRTTVFYIGSTKNIRKRLREHLGKNSKNGHIKGFLKKAGCCFRYIQFSTPHFLKEEERRLYKLFVATYGVPPRCNRVRP